MTPTLMFDMKKITTPLLLHMLGKELRFPRLFLLMRKLTLNRFKKTIDPRFPCELVDLAALPAWVYLNLKQKIGQRKAFEIMRVALLTGGTAARRHRTCSSIPFTRSGASRTLRILRSRTTAPAWSAGTRWKSLSALTAGSKSRSHVACSTSLPFIWASPR